MLDAQATAYARNALADRRIAMHFRPPLTTRATPAPLSAEGAAHIRAGWYCQREHPGTTLPGRFNVAEWPLALRAIDCPPITTWEDVLTDACTFTVAYRPPPLSHRAFTVTARHAANKGRRSDWN